MSFWIAYVSYSSIQRFSSPALYWSVICPVSTIYISTWISWDRFWGHPCGTSSFATHRIRRVKLQVFTTCSALGQVGRISQTMGEADRGRGNQRARGHGFHAARSLSTFADATETPALSLWPMRWLAVPGRYHESCCHSSRRLIKKILPVSSKERNNGCVPPRGVTKFWVNTIRIYNSKLIYYKNIFRN